MKKSETTIGKNTIYVGVQKVINILISLLISRFLLKAIGVDDFGLYGLVGSIVVMFNSLKSLFSSSIQRFINVAKGNNSPKEINSIFSMGVIINFCMAIITFIILEVGGLCILPSLDIRPEKYTTAFWILQFSILSSIIVLITVPYDAIIIANEKFGIYSILLILDCILRLICVFCLYLFSYNRVIFYALFLVLISILIRCISINYTKRHFLEETRFRKEWDKSLFKKMTGFAGWNFCGNFGYSLTNEGLNIILNLFGGVLVNAARTITYQIFNAVKQFTSDLLISLNPRSTILYTQKDIVAFMNIQVIGSKISYGISMLIMIPLLCFAKTVVNLWLGEVPPYTITFIYAITPYLLIRSLHPFIDIAFKAAGRLKAYQICELCCMVTSLPLTWIFLKYKFPYYFVFLIMGFMELINLILTLRIAQKTTLFQTSYYLKRILPNIGVITVIGIVIIYLVYHLIDSSTLSSNMAYIIMIEFILLLSFYLILLNKKERNILDGYYYKIKRRLKKLS